MQSTILQTAVVSSCMPCHMTCHMRNHPPVDCYERYKRRSARPQYACGVLAAASCNCSTSLRHVWPPVLKYCLTSTRLLLLFLLQICYDMKTMWNSRARSTTQLAGSGSMRLFTFQPQTIETLEIWHSLTWPTGKSTQATRFSHCCKNYTLT